MILMRQKSARCNWAETHGNRTHCKQNPVYLSFLKQLGVLVVKMASSINMIFMIWTNVI